MKSHNTCMTSSSSTTYFQNEGELKENLISIETIEKQHQKHLKKSKINKIYLINKNQNCKESKDLDRGKMNNVFLAGPSSFRSSLDFGDTSVPSKLLNLSMLFKKKRRLDEINSFKSTLESTIKTTTHDIPLPEISQSQRILPTINFKVLHQPKMNYQTNIDFTIMPSTLQKKMILSKIFPKRSFNIRNYSINKFLESRDVSHLKYRHNSLPNLHTSNIGQDMNKHNDIFIYCNKNSHTINTSTENIKTKKDNIKFDNDLIHDWKSKRKIHLKRYSSFLLKPKNALEIKGKLLDNLDASKEFKRLIKYIKFWIIQMAKQAKDKFKFNNDNDKVQYLKAKKSINLISIMKLCRINCEFEERQQLIYKLIIELNNHFSSSCKELVEEEVVIQGQIETFTDQGHSILNEFKKRNKKLQDENAIHQAFVNEQEEKINFMDNENYKLKEKIRNIEKKIESEQLKMEVMENNLEFSEKQLKSMELRLMTGSPKHATLKYLNEQTKSMKLESFSDYKNVIKLNLS